jgi:hypothetical protein
VRTGIENRESGIGVAPETTVAGQHSLGPRPLLDAVDVFPIPYSLFPIPAGGTA